MSLRFHHGGALQQRVWAAAIRDACLQLPGALLGISHKTSKAAGTAQQHRHLLAPVAATKHLLSAPLSVTKHRGHQQDDTSAPGSNIGVSKPGIEHAPAPTPAVSTMAGKLDAAAE